MHPLQKLAYEIMAESGDKLHLTKPLHEYLPGEGIEREGAEIGRVYVISQRDIDDYRIGSSWMEHRLFAGDICLCIAHAGDCFNDYILLELFNNAVKGIPESKFGAYVLSGDPLNWKPNQEEFEKLCSGGYIATEWSKTHPLVEEVGPFSERCGD